MKTLLILPAVLLLVNLCSPKLTLNMTCKTVAISTCISGYQYTVEGSFERIVLSNSFCVP